MSDLPEGEIEDEEEASVNQVVDATPVIAVSNDQPTMSPQVLWAFCNDCAQNIMPYREVALRYGFMDVPELRNFLTVNNEIRRRVKELRAVWHSDENVETRIRHLAQHAVQAAIPGTAQIMLNPRNPDATRLDALMSHAKIAGVGHAPAANAAGGIPGGGRFSVQIIFPNSGKTESFTTIDQVPDPPKEDAT